MYTILGAGGAIANEFSKVLIAEKQPLRLVSRNPRSMSGAETRACDLTNLQETSEAVRNSSIVLLTPGLSYDINVWRKWWPLIMQNTIDACKQHQAKLIFFDNIYCLGKGDGMMTEESPFNPTSKKGEVRAAIATLLLNEIKSSNITALIARSADFYGPDCKTSAFNTLVIDRLAKGKKAHWLVNDQPKHSFTYTPDCGRAIGLLSKSETAWNQIWHMPTARPPLTGKQMVELAAKFFGVTPRSWVISKGMGKIGGLFSTLIREVNEMNYQNDSDYIFDSSKFEKAFALQPTSYEEGISATVESYRK